MKSYSRYQSSGRRRGGDGSHWLSFSDLMSSLVMIIILVMFYIIYQYFNLAETNQAILEEKQAQLEVQQTQLDEQQTKLNEQEEQLTAAQSDLATKETELQTAQTELQDAQDQLSAKQTEVDEKEASLQETQTALDAAQEELDARQAQIDEQQTQLEEQQTQIEQLVGLKTRLISSLSSALKAGNISASVDPANGSIALESDVLFESGEYELTERGKEFVDRFLPVYLDVLFSDEYKGYVSEIIIEGHTDSDGGYLDNLELSQQRALAVASYVLGTECQAISADVKNELRPVVTVNGRSYSDRIFSADGTEDKEASRRVVFKFRLTDEQMIQQLRDILEE